MASAGDIGGTIFFAIIVLLLIVALIYLIFHFIRKRREARVHHVELYFDEHFRDIINEWDLSTRTKVKNWEKDMVKRLDTVGKDINKLMGFRKNFDARLDKLDSDIRKYEVL
jgi:hypothetical protein